MVKKVTSVEEYNALLTDNTSVVVDFFATWCGPCKMVAPIVEQISEQETSVAFVKVDVDEVPEIASKYGIMSIPTIIAIKNGSEMGKQVGFAPAPVIQQLVNKAK